MAGLYDTLNVKIPNIELEPKKKNELSKWFSSLTNKEEMKQIFSLIVEHAKRNNVPYKEPYGMKYKVCNNIPSPHFSLNEMPEELNQILWKFFCNRNSNI